MKLEAGKRELEEMIAEGEERIKAIEKAKEGKRLSTSLLTLLISFSLDTIPRTVGICPTS